MLLPRRLPMVATDLRYPAGLPGRFDGHLLADANPSAIKRRTASPRLRMRLSNDQSSIAFTSEGVIIVVTRSDFSSGSSGMARCINPPNLIKNLVDTLAQVYTL